MGAGEGEGPVVWLNECRDDDYHGLDMVGKIALCRRSDDPTVYRAAIEHQVGGLLLLDREHEGDQPFRRGGYRDTSWVPETIPAYLISGVVGEDLLAGTDLTLDDLSLRFSATPLSTTVRMAVTTEEREAATARNVLGLLPGSDPGQRPEVLVVGAHYDHLGPEPDGTIMRGANDNASGVATVLEMARTWRSEDFRPARSVLFAAWDGEEQGLLGSRYYVEHPTQSLTRTLAMLNLDMVGAGETLQIDGDGPAAVQVETAADTYGVIYTSSFHGRSDHVPFAEAGVPAAMLIWWPDEAYHSPDDEVDHIDPGKLKTGGVLSSHTVAALAETQVELNQAMARLEASIATGDREAFLESLEPTGLDASTPTGHPGRSALLAWFDELRSADLIDISMEPTEMRIGDGEADVGVRLRFVWADGDRRVSSVLSHLRFVERDGAWRFGGQSLETRQGDVVTVGWLPDVAVDAGGLLSTTETAYVSLVEGLGGEPVSGTRIVYYPDDETLRVMAKPTAQSPLAWVQRSDSLAELTLDARRSESITRALVSLVLTQAGLPSGEGTWLREGLALQWGTEDSARRYLPVLSSSEVMTPLLDFPALTQLTDDEAQKLRAYAWSTTGYLLEQYGVEGLRAFCAAWGEEGDGARAFRQVLRVSEAQFEAAWRRDVLAPLRAAAQGIDDTIVARARAVVDSDRDAYLSTVTTADPVLRADERDWLASVTHQSVLTHTLEGEMVGWKPELSEAIVALRSRTVISGGRSSSLTFDARFVVERGGWRYAGLPWDELRGEHFVLKHRGLGARQAQFVLTQAGAAFDRVASDLGAPGGLPLVIKAYTEDELLRAFKGFHPDDAAPGSQVHGASIKLLIDPAALESPVGPPVARELTYRLLTAKGIDTAWILEGVSAFEADSLRTLGRHQASAQQHDALWDAIGGGEIHDWEELVSFDHLSAEELALARAQSWSLVATIVREHGTDGLRRFLDQVAGGANAPSSVRAALSVDWETLLDRWREDVRTSGAPTELISLGESFDVDRAFEHIAQLASPPLRGRQAGTPGADRAADYIAGQFARLGLEPLGDAVTVTDPSGVAVGPGETERYLQHFPISYTHVVTVPSLAWANPRSGRERVFDYRKDFVEATGAGAAEGPLVWLSSSDLEGLHFGGAVVLAEWDDPLESARSLEEHGAGGLILVSDRSAEDLRAERVCAGARVAPGTIPVLEITEEALDRLLREVGVRRPTLAATTRTLPLDVEARMNLPRLPLTTTQTANVLGMIPGSDPELAQEALVIGAHYDHAGGLPGGDHFPGANQNASGVAALLEMARVWRAEGFEPSRPVVLAAWGAEERSSSGVKYYLEDPAVPLTRTAGVISLDSIADGEGFRLWFRGDGDKDLVLAHRLGTSASLLKRDAWRRGAVDDGWHALFSRQEIPTVKLTWADAESLDYRLNDTPGRLDRERLSNSGEILTMGAAWLSMQ